MGKRQCTHCKKFKNIKMFSPNKSREDGLNCWCKKCINTAKQELNKRCPWKRTRQNIKDRCENTNCKDYPYYGGRGIENRITEEELEMLWYRDKAWLLDQPSIDRKDNDGHYTFENCQYIEFSVNSGKDKQKPIIQLDKEGNFIREWQCGATIEKETGIQHTNISATCVGKRQTAGGFKWKFKL